ncbi:MAG: putative toxin-antitoxin system toxin component, family [Anaerolineales bacterium]|nr:putative toxin-antitoxin system toxin component, family [Anaerolineales bacterium]
MDDALPRVLVDTNVWVSAFINTPGQPARVIEAFLEDRFVPVTPRALADEIHEVLRRPRIRRRWRLSDEESATVLALLQDRAIEVIPPGELRLCRDPDDDILLETAIIGGAQYFVSRDDDVKRDQQLIARLQDHGVKVLSVAQFLSLFETRSP